MNAETMLDAKKALELGFVNEIIAPLSAKININFTGQMTDEKKLSIFDKICALFSGKDDVKDEADAPEIKMQDFTTADGGKISVETDTTPKVGDPASPDGEHVMPDGNVIVVVDGVITEIRTKEEKEDEASNEIEALKAEIEALKAEIEAQKQSNDELNQTIEELKGKADKAQDDTNALLEQMKHLSSTFKPEGRIQEKEVTTETKSAYFVQRMEEIKAKNKKK
jgi:ATP-dependent Clp protease protease subunit